jgi:hypothetical protein
VIVDLQSDLRKTAGHLASAGTLQPAQRTTSNPLSRNSAPPCPSFRPSARSRATTRRLWPRINVRCPEPNPPLFKGLSALQLSCSFFRLSRPLFSITSGLFCKNTGGMGTPQNLCFRISNFRTLFPGAVCNLVTPSRVRSLQLSRQRPKSFRFRSYEKCAPNSFRMRSYENSRGGGGGAAGK